VPQAAAPRQTVALARLFPQQRLRRPAVGRDRCRPPQLRAGTGHGQSYHPGQGQVSAPRARGSPGGAP